MVLNFELFIFTAGACETAAKSVRKQGRNVSLTALVTFEVKGQRSPSKKATRFNSTNHTCLKAQYRVFTATRKASFSMRLLPCFAASLFLLLTSSAAYSNLSIPLSSHNILPSNFKPPEVFKNVNSLRTINLEKGYIKVTINVVIENVDTNSQTEYYIPFKTDVISKVGGLEIRDRKDPGKPPFAVDITQYDPYRLVVMRYYLHHGEGTDLLFSNVQFARVVLPSPLEKSSQKTLAISYHILSAQVPLPASIRQDDKQYLLHAFSTSAPSAYPTENQKTKVKFPTVDVRDVTSEPERQGSTFTYGPYENAPAGAEEEASARYEFTKPIIHVTRLERDIEVSHWGGNLATEERYWLTNKAAYLTDHFSRVSWATAQFYQPPTTALKSLNVPLKVGSLDPYFVDDIGNVSTSRFRSNSQEANLELKPRYPIFGGWYYNFRIGWNANLGSFLRTLKKGHGKILKVPFIEGPTMGEGVSYEKVELRIILPEGATNVKYQSPIAVVSEEIYLYKSFMDTRGRTTLKLVALNLIDESRGQEILVSHMNIPICGNDFQNLYLTCHLPLP